MSRHPRRRSKRQRWNPHTLTPSHPLVGCESKTGSCVSVHLKLYLSAPQAASQCILPCVVVSGCIAASYVHHTVPRVATALCSTSYLTVSICISPHLTLLNCIELYHYITPHLTVSHHIALPSLHSHLVTLSLATSGCILLHLTPAHSPHR